MTKEKEIGELVMAICFLIAAWSLFAAYSTGE